MWKSGNSFGFISEVNKGTQRLTPDLRVSQVYDGIKKGDAEHLCLATVLEMQLKTAPKSRACFLDCVPFRRTVYPENWSPCALHWRIKEVTNLPIQYLSNEKCITYSMEQMKSQSSEDVLSFSCLFLLLQTNENRLYGNTKWLEDAQNRITWIQSLTMKQGEEDAFLHALIFYQCRTESMLQHYILRWEIIRLYPTTISSKNVVIYSQGNTATQSAIP